MPDLPPEKRERAFVHFAQWRAALAQFRRGLNLAVDDGSLAGLPDGGRAFGFNHRAQSREPFTVEHQGESAQVYGGVIALGGTMRVIADTQLTTGAAWTIGLNMSIDLAAAANAPGDPWDIYVSLWSAQLTVAGLGFPGEHPLIEDLDASANENIAVTSAQLFYPLASYDGAGIVAQHHTGHLILGLRANGRVVQRGFYPAP